LRAELNAEKSDAIAARAQVRKLLAQVAAEREACAVTVDGWLHPGFAAQQVGELNSDQQAAVFVVLKAVARAIRERKP
jgi:sulfur carrier protein ThiS